MSSSLSQKFSHLFLSQTLKKYKEKGRLSRAYKMCLWRQVITTLAPTSWYSLRTTINFFALLLKIRNNRQEEDEQFFYISQTLHFHLPVFAFSVFPPHCKIRCGGNWKKKKKEQAEYTAYSGNKWMPQFLKTLNGNLTSYCRSLYLSLQFLSS